MYDDDLDGQGMGRRVDDPGPDTPIKREHRASTRASAGPYSFMEALTGQSPERLERLARTRARQTLVNQLIGLLMVTVFCATAIIVTWLIVK